MTNLTKRAPISIDEHPPLHVWEEELFKSGAILSRDLQVHLERCVECKQLVSRLEVWREITLPRELSAVYTDRTDPLRERILSSRAAGVRTIVPMLAVESEEHALAGGSTVSWWRSTPKRVAAAVLALLCAGSVLRQPPALEAGMVAGKLELMPAYPRLGDTVHVTYSAAGLFGTPPILRLRARMRTESSTSQYANKAGVTLTMLRRTKANRYEGRFVLPDSVVYAALAVEDTAATAFDDFGGRGWEVMRSSARNVLLSSALRQRFEDFMGRSWEELLATARKRVGLYPDSVGAWSELQFVESAMGVLNDSTLGVHKTQATRFSLAMQAGTLPVQHGRMFWYASRSGDTVLAEQWRTRLLREAPTDEFAVQERAIQLYQSFTTNKDTAGALVAMERLWADTPVQRREQVAQVALAMIGHSQAYSSDMLRWTRRYRMADPSVYRQQWIARQLAAMPTLRDSAIAQLTALAVSLDSPDERQRALNETRAQFTQRMRGERVLTEAILGQILVAAGRSAEALSRLRTLPDIGWNADVFAAIATAAASAGDTSLAAPHWARLVVDPRTSTKQVVRLDSLGAHYVGTAQWELLKQRTSAEMATAVVREARRRKVEPATVMSVDGHASSLVALAKGRPMVLVMFSPLCGPAVAALPAMQQMSARLQQKGVSVVLIAEQSTADDALLSVLKQAKYTGPVYLDSSKQASRALNNWATPQMYVLDRDGRVMFDPTSSTGEAILQMEALLATNAHVSIR